MNGDGAHRRGRHSIPGPTTSPRRCGSSRRCVAYPPKPRRRFDVRRIIVMRVQYRCAEAAAGRRYRPGPKSARQRAVQAAENRAVAMASHTTSESPGATAMTLTSFPVLGLIACHCGPEVGVFGARASLVRHSESPPAMIRFGWFGSSTNGAMNSAPRHRVRDSVRDRLPCTVLMAGSRTDR